MAPPKYILFSFENLLIRDIAVFVSDILLYGGEIIVVIIVVFDSVHLPSQLVTEFAGTVSVHTAKRKKNSNNE